jgi:hypothetical protein
LGLQVKQNPRYRGFLSWCFGRISGRSAAGNRAIRSNLLARQAGKKYFRFYPLRGQKSPSLAIFGLGVCAKRKLHEMVTAASLPPSYPPKADGQHGCCWFQGFRWGFCNAKTLMLKTGMETGF